MLKLIDLSVHNNVLRLKSELPQTQLLDSTNEISVMQQTAFHTIMTTHSHRVVTSGQPGYLAKKLKLRTEGDGIFPHRHMNTIAVPEVELTLSRGVFCYRAACLWNILPSHMRQGMKTVTFKRELKKWVRANISPRPPWIMEEIRKWSKIIFFKIK